MAVCGYLDAVFAHRIINKLLVFCREPVETLLDDVISVQILNESHDVGIEGGCNSMDLHEGKREKNCIGQHNLISLFSFSFFPFLSSQFLVHNFIRKSPYLLRRRQKLNKLLNCACAVHVE